ncbi:hypothetical protein B296_00004734 [Ensete ventricosum]|uniref:Uncharacterized protein n=1 Tax=Ensete ventricosum TaxID=4639 RepID=A0A427AFJ4_ENSVE|nr:hypothetical protein B296_00004734 [Ensete ventricosum]
MICLMYLIPDMVSSQLQLHRYATGRESRVVTALTLLKSHLFRYKSDENFNNYAIHMIAEVLSTKITPLKLKVEAPAEVDAMEE